MGTSLVLYLSLLAPLIILSSAVIRICAFILLRRQPVVLNGKFLAWVLVIAVLPINVGMIYLMVTAPETAVICYGVFIVLIQGVAYAAVLRAMRGIFIFGVSAEACRTALREVLGTLGLQTGETILGFDFTEQPGRLQVAIAPRLGTVQLKLVGGEDPSLLSAIMHEVKTYFQKHRGDFSLQSALIYGISGILGWLLILIQWTKF